MGSLLSQTLNTLTLCWVPDTRRNLWARVRQGSRLEDRFIGPANLSFCLSPRLLRSSSRVRRRAESSRVTLANHCAIPAAIYEDREFVDVGGLMSYECISSNQRVYRPSTKLLAIAVIE